MNLGAVKEGSPPSMSFFSDLPVAIFASERERVGHGTAFGAACLVGYSEVRTDALNASALLRISRSLGCHKPCKVPEVGRNLNL